MAQSKQQQERIALAVLLVIAGLVWFFYFGKTKTANGNVGGTGPYTPINAQDYSVIFKELGETQSTVYKSSGRNIFVAGPVGPLPSGTVAAVNTAKPEPLYPTVPVPPEPPKPVLPGKFFGYGSLPINGPRRAFLQEGDDVHIVQEGDIVGNHIRITHIGNDSIDYEDTVTGKKNSSTLELPPAA
jgi:hypothetical protein